MRRTLSLIAFLLPLLSFGQRRPSTAPSRMDTFSVRIPGLDRTRTVRVYKPATWGTDGRRYPVIYLQDGQNVFDDSTSYVGEWGVDEAQDSLERSGAEYLIVAVDHGGEKRLTEYNPYDTKYGKGEGAAYADFLTRTLRREIRRRYPRASRRDRHQFIGGSSMGALISFYTMLRHPGEWGGAAVFSPSFWNAPGLEADVQAKGRKVRGRVYFYAGGAEGESMVPDMMRIFGLLRSRTKADLLAAVIRAENGHNEKAWKAEWPVFVKWLSRKP